MASNLISRLLPSAADDEGHPPTRVFSRESDTDHTDDMVVDEENLAGHYEEQDLEALLADTAASEISEKSMASKPLLGKTGRTPAGGPSRIVPRWLQSNQRRRPTPRDEEDDVPESLMLEQQREVSPILSRKARTLQAPQDLPAPAPGPTTGTIRDQWERTKRQQQLHDDLPPPVSHARRAAGAVPRTFAAADPKERALWRWASVDNLDNFLQDVYVYYVAKGFWTIILNRLLQLVTIPFLVFLFTFLFYCVDYSKLAGAQKLSDIRIPQCARKLPWTANFALWVISAGWMYYLFDFFKTIPKNWDMRMFYKHLLDVKDGEVQTVQWPNVVEKLMRLRDQNLRTADLSAQNRRYVRGQSKERMDAHDIANRLMRKENYWISIFNRDILNYSVPVPFSGERHLFTKTLEWNLDVAMDDFVFDKSGQIRPEFLSSKNRERLVNQLKKRFRQVALYNLICCAPLVFFFVASRFLIYFTEYKQNPASLMQREWTLHAQWKLREFNEVPHLFRQRIAMASQYTDRYMEQFPKAKTVRVARFVAFTSGVLFTVLFLITLLDNKAFLTFEIFGRLAVFWLSLLGGIFAAAKGMIPEDSSIFEADFWIDRVAECTHYKPKHWEGKAHSERVLQEMSTMYKMEIILFLEELASVIFVPYIFWYQLPNSAAPLVDFFREFTIHIDGLGYVCSHAVFDFQNGGAPKVKNDPEGLRQDYFGARDNKLAESFQTFMLDYGDVPRKGLGRAPNHRRGHFQLPPSFPGLRGSRLYTDLAASMNYTPQLRPHPAPGSGLIQSTLLDEHHQPRAHNSPRQQALRNRTGLSRFQSLDADLDEHDEQEEENGAVRTTSAIMEEDSDLGDSWNVKADEAEMDDEEMGGKRKDDDVGVLQLLTQFQRVQTEGRGLNI